MIVVLHVNLMMGDATVLARLLSRTDSSPAALPRAMFVINRSDEFGVDPLGDPDEFRRRRLRKEAELRALLSAANLGSAPVIHTVSGDAFSLVGDRFDITRADYSDAGRYWDGMAALEAALTATSGVADRMQERAALEEAHSGLFLIRGDLERRSKQAERDKADSQGTLTELDNAIRSGTLLASALEKRAHRLVRAHAERAMADALSASPERLDRAARAASTWWLDPVFTADATSYWTQAQREIDQWTKETGSAIRRSMPAGSQPPLESVRGKRKLPKSKRRGAARKAAAASKAGSGASKAIGSRDAVYRIGKTFGHKFKPWGATKGAMRVTRVGAVLSVVTVAFDVYGWVAAVKAAGDAEEYRQDLVSFIEDSIEQVTEKLTRSNEPEGPLTVLEAAVNDCGQDAARLDQAVHQHEASLSTLDRQLALVHDLLAAMPEASTLHEEIA